MIATPVFVVLRHDIAGKTPVIAFANKQAASDAADHMKQDTKVFHNFMELDLITRTGE